MGMWMVTAGTYTVIVSTFEPRTTTPLALHVECSAKFEMESIPAEGAGMFSRVVRGEWCVSFTSSVWRGFSAQGADEGLPLPSCSLNPGCSFSDYVTDADFSV